MSGFTYLINLQVNNGGAFGKLASMAEGLETSLSRVNKSIGGVESSLGKVAQRGAGFFNNLKESAGGFIGQLAGIGAGVGLLKLTEDMEQTNLAFEVMLKDAGKAKQLIGELNQFANITPFSNTDVLQSGKNLAAFGFDALDILPTLQKVGDVASGLNIPLTEMSSIFGKMKVRDIMHANDLELFTDRGIPIITELGKVMGVADSAIYKMASDGEINFGHISQAFTNMTGAGGQFENMMARQSETLGGKWSTLLGTLEMTAITFGTKLIPPLITAINLLIPFAEWVGRNTETLLAFGVGFGSVYAAQLLYNGATAVATFLTGGLSGAVNMLTVAFRANPLGWIATGFGILAGAVTYAWSHFEGFRGFIYGMWDTFKEFGSIILDFLVAPLMGIGKLLTGIFTFDSSLIAEGFNDSIKAVQDISEKGGGIFARLGNAYGTGAAEGINNFNAGQPKGAMGALFEAGKTPNYAGVGGNNGKSTTQAKELSNSITGGGQRNITINLGKLQDQTVIYTTNVKDGGQRMGDEIIKVLAQVLNSANSTQGK